MLVHGAVTAILEIRPIVASTPALSGHFFCETVNELQYLPPDEQEEILRVTGFQEFVRLNFGLYSPPGDYRALRAENLRRSIDPQHLISRRTVKVL